MESKREEFIENLKIDSVPTYDNTINQELNSLDILKYLDIKKSSSTDKTSKTELEKQEVLKVLEYFKNNKLNINNITYWDRSRIDSNGNLYIDGYLVNEDLYSKINDIFILNESLVKIFQLELQELGIPFNPYNREENEFLIKFNNSSKVDNRGGYVEPDEGKKPSIKIYEQSLYKGLSSNNSDERQQACKDIFKSLLHEIQHHRQYMLTQLNTSNKDSLLYAKEFALHSILEEKFYSRNEEFGNYYEFATENNAKYVGASKYSSIMEDNSLFSEIEFCRAYFSESKYFIDASTKDGNKHFKYSDLQEKIDGATRLLDETITPEYITKYPILQKEYNMDGTRKNAIELITNLKQEINQINSIQELSCEDKQELMKNANEMYYELIYMELQNNPEVITDISKSIGHQNAKKVLNDISNYFENEKTRRIGNCKILSQKEYLERGENSEEVYKEDSENINKYYNNKKNFLSELSIDLENEIEEQKFI